MQYIYLISYCYVFALNILSTIIDIICLCSFCANSSLSTCYPQSFFIVNYFVMFRLGRQSFWKCAIIELLEEARCISGTVQAFADPNPLSPIAPKSREFLPESIRLSRIVGIKRLRSASVVTGKLFTCSVHTLYSNVDAGHKARLTTARHSR